MPTPGVESRLGDLTASDEHLFPASAHGRNRRQRAPTDLGETTTPAEVEGVAGDLASQFVGPAGDGTSPGTPRATGSPDVLAPRHLVEQGNGWRTERAGGARGLPS